MKSWLYHLLIAIVFVLIGWFGNVAYNLPKSSKNPIAEARPTPLAKYSIEKLSKAKVETPELAVGKILKDGKKFTSYEFSFDFDPTLTNQPKKKVSGLINIPVGAGPFPVIVMFRGYVDQKSYSTGEGTQHAAEFFAGNGFITVAPDFLGYGDSDSEAQNVFEARFQTLTTAMETLEAAKTINLWDKTNMFIWAHSNGGQIALSALETTGAKYPTVLWAPVSKPFPYSILYYTIEADDGGKALRRELANFEKDYDTDIFSLTRYLNLIKAPIQINQGTADAEVPFEWSGDLETSLKAATVSATLIKYPGADHNMTPGWTDAVQNNLSFYKANLH